MKKITAVFFSLLFVFCMITPAFADLSSPLSFETQSYAFAPAVYSQGSDEVFEAVLKNTGEKTLTFSSMLLLAKEKHMAFTVNMPLTPAVTQLAPGESYTYTVGINKDIPAGEYTQTYTICTSEPEEYSACFMVKARVNKADYKTPKLHFYAHYNDWLHSIMLPQTDNGTMTWWSGYNRSTKVGELGDNIFYVTYLPPDLNNFNTVEKLPVTVTVLPAKPEFDLPELKAVCGQSLAEAGLELPFAWCVKSPENVKLLYGKNSYAATYFPEDTLHYESVTVMVPVTVDHAPKEQQKLTADENGHSYICACGEVCLVEPHSMTTVTVNSTECLKCSVCGYETPAPQSEEGLEEQDPTKPQKPGFLQSILNIFERIKNIFNQLLQKLGLLG